MKRSGGHAHDEASAVPESSDVAAGKRSLTEGLAGAGGGAGAPVLQLKPAEGKKLSGDESYVDSLLGPDTVQMKKAEGKGGEEEEEEKDPSWMDPGSQEILPGEPVPLHGPYTEADRKKLKDHLEKRSRENKREAGEFLREFVDASVSIVAKYAMDSVKEKDQLAGFIKFALAEGLASIAGGVPGLLGKKAVEFLASKAVDYFAGQAMEDEEVFQDEKDMRTLIDEVASASGKYVEGMVKELGADEIDLAFWLGKAKPEDFHRFRIPARFESPPRDLIRGAVAGTVAGRHHRMGIGGQMLSGVQWIETDHVDPKHDNHVVTVDVLAKNGQAHVNKARFKSNSKTLSDEIVGKVGLASLENVALHVTVTDKSGEKAAIRKLLEALRSPFPVEDGDEALFAKTYPPGAGPLVFTRMPDGTIGSQGGTFAEQLLMYQWADGDHDYSWLAQQINATEDDEDSQTSRPGYHAADHLAKQVNYHVSIGKLKGAHMMASSQMFAVQVPTKG